MTYDPTAFGRLTHHHPNLEVWRYEEDNAFKLPVVSVAGGANVVSSLLTNGRHAPAIDLDLPAVLVPTSTFGHSHLYLDHEMRWDHYRRLLKVMAAAGLVEPGFYESAVRRGTTLLRLPGASKGVPAADPSEVDGIPY